MVSTEGMPKYGAGFSVWIGRTTSRLSQMSRNVRMENSLAKFCASLAPHFSAVIRQKLCKLKPGAFQRDPCDAEVSEQ